MLKKILKWTGLALLALVLLVALFYAVENIRGRLAWQRYKHECAAKGEDIEDWQSLIPPPIPDGDNVAMVPIIQDLLADPPRKRLRLPFGRYPRDINTNAVSGAVWQIGKKYPEYLDGWRVALSNDNLLAALSVYDDDLRKVEEALKRPSFRSPKWNNASITNFSALFPEIGAPVNLAYIYALLARAKHEAGQYDGMLADIQTGIRIANLFFEDLPMGISVPVRAGMLHMVCTPLWSGVGERVWDVQQLSTLQGMLENINLAEHAARANRFERRLYANFLILSDHQTILEAIRHDPPFRDKAIFALAPSGWFYQNAVPCAKAFDPSYLAIHAVERWFDIAQAKRAEAAIEAAIEDLHIFAIAARMFSPSSSTLKSCAQTQALLHQATLACAIERYRLERGRIPQRLDELTPHYLAKIPCDPCDGHPMRYKPSADGNYILYSIGWNGTDDNGQLAWNEKRHPQTPNPDEGDWVWRSSPLQEPQPNE